MVGAVSNTKINNIITSNTRISVPSFKAQTPTALERIPQTDTVEVEQKKKEKGLSTGAKVGIGIVGTFVAILGTALAVSKHQHDKIAKLYKEKLVLSNLGEHIQFTEAKTVEEGIKFAKEVLKIPEVDKDFTLEAINVANKGLVDVSNANKGKLFMPRALRFAKPAEGDSWSAYVCRDIKSDRFGELGINSTFFTHETLDKLLKKDLYNNNQRLFWDMSKGEFEACILINNIIPVPDKTLSKLIQKFYETPDMMSINEKHSLLYSIRSMNNSLDLYKRAPIDFLKKLEKFDCYIKYLNAGGEKIDFNKIKDLSTEKQAKYTQDILKKMLSSKQPLALNCTISSSETTIYHEMGHLQDYAKNLKELGLAKWKLPNLKQAWNEAKEGKNSQNRQEEVDELTNRWGSKDSHKGIKKLFDEKPDEFKKVYPELYEFLTDKKTQQTAGKISRYAQSGIGEFIAETYKDMILGKEIPVDVMKLYEKYNGPKLPN